MEESILYLWCLTDTRDLSLNNKTRFPARSTPFRELSSGMELAGLFENEYLHEALSSLKLEEVGEDYVTISFRGERFTLHKGPSTKASATPPRRTAAPTPTLPNI